MKNNIIILCGAPEPDYTFLSSYDFTQASIIAVDSGAEICKTLNLLPDLLVGDFDSVSHDTLSIYTNVPRLTFATRKNASDTELAIDEAIMYSPESIILLNAAGKRHDHFLFNIRLLWKYPYKTVLCDANGNLRALVPGTVYKPDFTPGITFSLIPFDHASGITISGAEYPLDNAVMTSATRTLSNISRNSTEISYTEGKLLLFWSR